MAPLHVLVYILFDCSHPNHGNGLHIEILDRKEPVSHMLDYQHKKVVGHKEHPIGPILMVIPEQEEHKDEQEYIQKVNAAHSN